MARPPISLKGRALRYLSMREHSRVELRRKLQPHVTDSDDLEAVLDWLETSDFLNNDRFVQSLVHRKSSRYGAQRIIAELKQHQIKTETLSQTRTELLAEEKVNARAVWEKKFGVLPQSMEERAKQMRFLLQRGFSQGAVRSVLKGEDDDFPSEDVYSI
jgi:regulatory protein